MLLNQNELRRLNSITSYKHLDFGFIHNPHLSIKARNLCLSVCVWLSVCLCMCASNISADQDQTDLRVGCCVVQGCATSHLFGVQLYC